MKPLLVFCYDNYYPAGGEGDFIGAFDETDPLPDNLSEFMDVLDIRTGTWRAYTWDRKLKLWRKLMTKEQLATLYAAVDVAANGSNPGA